MSSSNPIAPVLLGFEYEVRIAVKIPLVWAELLKLAAKHHYDYKCRESGERGVVNALYNTAQGGTFECSRAVSWSDLDLVMKVAEQLRYHTKDFALIGTINKWIHETLGAIARQRRICMQLPGSAKEAP